VGLRRGARSARGRTPIITCAEAVRQLWEYLDGTLDENEREAIDEHLSFCRTCCGEAEFAEELRKFLRSSAEVELPDDVRARLGATLSELESP
jgi:anti-sigma factor (TIGR02949 family)